MHHALISSFTCLSWHRPPPSSTLFPYTTLFRSPPARSRCSRTRSRASSCQPVVPTTACTPASMSACTFASVALGTVKSTATSATPASEATSSPRSRRATRSIPSASSTARHTVAPIRPAAPSTATRMLLAAAAWLIPARVAAPAARTSTCSVGGQRRGGDVLVERADHGQVPGLGVQVGGQGAHVLGSDGPQPREALLDGEELPGGDLAAAEPGHP